ncbi:MAG: ABC transporter ATP-binding protein [Ilumatobacter sp.]|nr:ABC transporter ATP-binding protein [Ilumatobacter sp.]
MAQPRQDRFLRTLGVAMRLVVRANRGLLAFSVVASVVSALAVAGQLLVGRTLLDLLATDDRVSAGELAPSLALLGVLLVVGALSQASLNEIRVLLSEQVHRLAMHDILDVATEVDYEAYERAEFHDRLQRASMAAGGQSAAVVFGVITLMSTLIVTIGVVGVVMAVVPLLLPIALVSYVPVAFVNVRNTRARYRFEFELTELQRDKGYLEYLMTDRVQAKEIRSFRMAPTLRTWWENLWQVRLAQLRQLVRRRLTLTTIGTLVTTSALVATLSLALILAGRGSITIGDAAVAIVGLQQLNNRLQSAGTAFNGVHEGVAFLRDFESFRSALPEIRANRGGRVPPTPPSLLTVDRLGYRYPGATEDALSDVSFELRRGQIMAVVGANGSGKSTLAKLVCGLLAPARGAVSWDGVDIGTCDPDLVRAQIAPVFQDFGAYLLRVDQVIGLGDTERLDHEGDIAEAARRSGLLPALERLPHGLSTRLGKAFTDGVDLSGGQWQRLAIARALFRDAPVLVLDEPSASLDPQGEAELFDLLHQICDDRIVVFVSHRFATVRDADAVLVMDQGRVVEFGSHDELMTAGGMYRDLFTLQASRFGDGN